MRWPFDRLIEPANSKTGVFLKDTGARDEHGMQPLDDIFSSPEKENEYDEPDDESDEEPMDIDEGKSDPGITSVARNATKHPTDATQSLHQHHRPS